MAKKVTKQNPLQMRMEMSFRFFDRYNGKLVLVSLARRSYAFAFLYVEYR